MGDFLQLSVKRRRKEKGFPDSVIEVDKGFLDYLNEEYKRYKDDPQNTGNKIRERVGVWLMEEKLLGDSPNDLVDLLGIVDTIMNRICEIAGHAWIEFVEDASDDSIRGAAEAQRDRINAYVAEFIPGFNIDLIFEAFESAGGGKVPWYQITNEHLLRLFAHLFEESTINRTILPRTDRYPAGAVSGNPSLLSPDQLRQQPAAWFRDRQEPQGPYMTPVWEVKAPRAAIDSIRQKSIGLRYSFTPEYYEDGDNCVTFAARVLGSLVPGDWLEIIRAQCVVSPKLAPERCEDYHILEHGRMRCAEGYASLADARRQRGLRRF